MERRSVDGISLAEQIAVSKNSLTNAKRILEDRQRWVKDAEGDVLFWTSILTSLNNLDS